jgi:hypothetical protein
VKAALADSLSSLSGSGLCAKWSEMEKKIESLEKELSSLKTSLSQKDSSILTLQATLAQKDSLLSENDAEIANLRKEIESLKKLSPSPSSTPKPSPSLSPKPKTPSLPSIGTTQFLYDSVPAKIFHPEYLTRTGKMIKCTTDSRPDKASFAIDHEISTVSFFLHFLCFTDFIEGIWELFFSSFSPSSFFFIVNLQ